MKEQFHALIKENNYVGHNGWVEETIVEPVGEGYDDFDDKLKPFIGSRVKITIEKVGLYND